MYILGISAFYHDSAACLVKDGIIITASQEVLLNDHRKYDRMAQEMNPCGDGKTSEKILSHIKSYFFDPVLDSK